MDDNDIDNAVEVIDESIWQTIADYKPDDYDALQVLKRVQSNLSETIAMLEQHIYEEAKLKMRKV